MIGYQNLLIALFWGLYFLASGQESFLYQTREYLLHERINDVINEEYIYDRNGDLIIRKVTNPSLVPFIPSDENTNKTAVIICPGGGYNSIHMQREGFRVAEYFNEQGIAAFVLKYRLPDKEIISDKSSAPLQDAQRAIQLLRENHEQWGIAPDKIGIMGFSAGGHLASSAGVHYDSILVENKQSTSLRPNFMMLVYPVISFDDAIVHKGSKSCLLGQQPAEELVRLFSNELQVKADSPKTILFHAEDDITVPVENTLRFYNELVEKGISSEVHIYSRGGHGFKNYPLFEDWFSQCINWMKIEGFHISNE